MNLINENAGDHRPIDWNVIEYMAEHERGLNKLRLQTVFGVLNRQRSQLRMALAALDRGDEAGMSPEEHLHKVYLRDGLVGAYTALESSLASLCDAAGYDTMIDRQPLPELGGFEAPPSSQEELPF